MRNTTVTLLNRQRDGKVTNFTVLSSEVGKSLKATIFELAMAEQEGEIKVAYWSGYSPTGKMYAVPTPATIAELKVPAEELIWPYLTNEILVTNFAARIFVYNYLNPINYESFPLRNPNWFEQLGYLYENLAVTIFGPKESWVMEKGLLTGLPIHTPDGVYREPKVFKRNTGQRSASLVCRFCCDRIADPVDAQRGLHTKCLEQISLRTEYGVKDLLNSVIITDSKLEEILAALRPGRPKYTEEEAKKFYPNGYISVAEVVAKAKEMGIPPGRIVKAFGGDGGFAPTFNPNWGYFTIGRSRYLDIRVLEDLETIKGNT